MFTISLDLFYEKTYRVIELQFEGSSFAPKPSSACSLRGPLPSSETPRKPPAGPSPEFATGKGWDYLPHCHRIMFWVHNRHVCSLRAGGRFSISLILHSDLHSIIHLLVTYVSKHRCRKCQRSV